MPDSICICHAGKDLISPRELRPVSARFTMSGKMTRFVEVSARRACLMVICLGLHVIRFSSIKVY
jgi:hypothetical protein